MSTAKTAPRPFAKPAAAAVAAPAPVVVAAPAAAAPALAAEEPRKRTPYVPKTLEEFEAEVSKLTNKYGEWKGRLYPTSSGKASADNAPSRRELDEQKVKAKSLIKDYAALLRQVSQKPRRRVAQPEDGQAPRAVGFCRPDRISQKMAEFIYDNFPETVDGRAIIDEGRICTRALLTSIAVEYVHRKKLRQTDGNKIVPDQTLLELFSEEWGPAGVDPKAFPHTHLQKLITRHVLSKSINEEEMKKVVADYGDHLVKVQAHFQHLKALRDANKPKAPKKPKAKKEEPAQPTA